MPQEHRQFFQIDDIVCLHTRTISKDGLPDRLDDFLNNQHAFSIRDKYNRQLEGHLPGYRSD